MINSEKIVFFTSLVIAICAASFSVYGIGLLFSGAAVAAMIMATTLELGKLVTTSWLFKNWKTANFLIKSYMTFAVLLLMAITSLGVFGYLSSAYQKSALENELRMEKISTYESNINDEYVRIENFKEEIDKLYISKSSQQDQLSEALNNPLISRNPIQLQTIQSQINSQIESISNNISELSSKIEKSNTTISDLNKSILEIKIEQSEQKDVMTFKFVAAEFNTGINTVAKWFIFLIIAVFDPLAVVLLMAASTTNTNNNKNDNKRDEKNIIDEITTFIPHEDSTKETDLEVDKVEPVLSNNKYKIEYGKYKLKNILAKPFKQNSQQPIEIIREVIKEVEKPVEIIKEVERPATIKGMYSF